jgi:hypothetical protein
MSEALPVVVCAMHRPSSPKSSRLELRPLPAVAISFEALAPGQWPLANPQLYARLDNKEVNAGIIGVTA